MKCLRVIDFLVLTLAARALGNCTCDDEYNESTTVSRHRHLRKARKTRKAAISERSDPGEGPVASPIFCSSSMDCDSTMYCAAGECLEMGSCETNMDCRNPLNLYLVEQHTGSLLCSEDSKRCRRERGPAFEDGSKPSDHECDVVPCDITDEICRWTDIVDTCQNDYANGCNALVFDQAGYHELCIGPLKRTEIKPCSLTGDCAMDGSEYCSRGTCMTSGQCSSDADCFNPENIYNTNECLGPLSCSDNGQCGRACSDLVVHVTQPK